MLLLLLGLLLWVAAHMFKRLAPERRAAMGDPGKGAIAAVIALGLILMIWGYRRADLVPLYAPWPGMVHVNNALMLVAVYLFGVGHSRGILRSKLRNPMLIGTAIWAGAHLLVNGDLASVILFGGLGLWAMAEIAIVDRAAPWVAPTPGRLRGDIINLVVALVLYGLIAAVHIWAGHNPFLGA